MFVAFIIFYTSVFQLLLRVLVSFESFATLLLHVCCIIIAVSSRLNCYIDTMLCFVWSIVRFAFAEM